MAKKKGKTTCFENILEYSKMNQNRIALSIELDLGIRINRQAVNKWVNRQYKVPDEYIEVLEKLLKTPREYWLDDKGKCSLYVGENKMKLDKYRYNLRWSNDGKLPPEIEKTIKKYNLTRGDEESEAIYYELSKKKEWLEIEIENMKEEMEHILFASDKTVESKIEYYNNVGCRYMQLKRILKVCSRENSCILDSVIDALERHMNENKYSYISSVGDIADKIYILLKDEERKAREKNEEDMRELTDFFGIDFENELELEDDNN